ncbi:MAG TPA: hypothetical protein VG986_00995 [Pseudolabrys sp.]|nr:hypothetical protein [Pseudolabrys sp.]
MKSKYLAAAAILVISTAPAFAYKVWQGTLFFTATDINAAACSGSGVSQYSSVLAVMAPAKIDTNGTNTRLTIFFPRSASNFTIANGTLNGAGNYTGTELSSKAHVFSWSGKFSGASTKPTPIATTPSIAVKFTVTNFENLIGCSATLAGVLGLRPGSY